MKSYFFPTKIVCLDKKYNSIFSLTAHSSSMPSRLGKKELNRCYMAFIMTKIKAIFALKIAFFQPKLDVLKKYKQIFSFTAHSNCIPSRLEKMWQNQCYLAFIITKRKAILQKKILFSQKICLSWKRDAYIFFFHSSFQLHTQQIGKKCSKINAVWPL